jgi:2',3'-cyclic-nucleotide 2'-phosphodiesterase (5'-nucleotidase family)
MKYSDPVAETDFSLECNEHGDFKESNLGPLVADAIYDYLNSHTEDGCDISMVAVGVIRDNIVPGIETAPDIFRIMSLGSGKDGVPGYPLSRLYLYGKELKNVLEILQVAYKSSASNYCFFSGLDVEYNPEKGLLRKISKIRIIDKEGDLSEVSFSKHDKTLYSITANFYMLEFIGIIKKMSFGLINVIPKDSEGNVVTDMQNSIIDMDEDIPGIQEGKEWLAMKEFLEKMEDYDHDGIPDIDRKYSVPVQTFHVAGK